MGFLALILNLPWTALGLLGAIASAPTSIRTHQKPLALIVTVRSFWWLPGHKGLRAATLGNVVLLSQKLLPSDLEHELIHVEQNEREPLIKPFLYEWQSLKYGYRNNKYEVEAYTRVGNRYVEKTLGQTPTIQVLYFNGLTDGTTRKREQLAITYLAKRGIHVEHVPIHWRSDESFESLLGRITKLTKERLKTHGKIILVGSSAGGSLVVNILSQLHDQNLFGITLCSRLHEAALPWWDVRSLKRMAHMGTPEKESQSFFDSVTYCGETGIPNLTEQDKRRLIVVQQWADFVVPRPTMSIKGVRIYKVPALGHGWGIAMGVWRLPEAVKLLDKSKN